MGNPHFWGIALPRAKKQNLFNEIMIENCNVQAEIRAPESTTMPKAWAGEMSLAQQMQSGRRLESNKTASFQN